MRIKILKIFRLFSYSPLEIFAVITALAFLVSAEITLRLSKSDDILAKLSGMRAKKPGFLFSRLNHLPKTRLASFVEAIDRNIGWKPSCLRRTFTLARLNTALGLNPELKIGVRREGRDLKAHSWLEFDGMRLEMDGESTAYSVLFPAK